MAPPRTCTLLFILFFFFFFFFSFSFSSLLLGLDASRHGGDSSSSSSLVWEGNKADAVQNLLWNVTSAIAAPLGTPKKVLLINGAFPGPQINTVTNENLLINVFNNLDEPLLFTWNGIWQRRTSWQDGVLGTNCPILPGQNFTYFFQVKDQIGSYFYFPSTGFLKAAGGYGGIKVDNRVIIDLPYPTPDGDVFLHLGDWYNANHTDLHARLDAGGALGPADGILINGGSGTVITLDPGKTYRIRVSNVGISTSLNFRIASHNFTVVETEGSHTQQNSYDNLDIHVGQTYSVLVTLDQAPGDYYIVASSRFTQIALNGTAILRYSNSGGGAPAPFPPAPAGEIEYSIDQAKSIRWNLTANAARPNPQGSFHYGMINVSEEVLVQGSGGLVNGKPRFSVNGISYVNPDTPLKLADYFGLQGVFSPDFPRSPPALGNAGISLGASVLVLGFRGFLELVFQNNEDIVQSWHIDGYAAFVVGFDRGLWTSANRGEYNLVDAVARSTFQVYPKSWTAVMLSLDNVGMWNVRSQVWERLYLGEQFYMKVPNPNGSFRDEAPIPTNVLLCGQASKCSDPNACKIPTTQP